MKKQVLAFALLFFTTIAFAQKKELRKCGNAIKKENFTDALDYLKELESMNNLSKAQQAEYNLYKGQVYSATAENNNEKLFEAADALKKAVSLDENPYSKEAQEMIPNLRVQIVNSAIQDQKNQKFETASEKLYETYKLSPKDTSDLFFAASYAIDGKNYDKAIKYYEELLDLGFTGIQTEYTVINKNTKEVEAFSTKEEQEVMLLSDEYIKPDKRKSKSKRGDILRNITYLYIEKDNIEKAKEIIKEARAESPNDISLIQAEANLALQLKDMSTYKKLMQKVVESDPENPELYYNLGVSAAELGENDEAEDYYKKAIELNPDYVTAKINLASLILSEEREIVEEMNNLGTTPADNKKYDELRNKRNELYKEAAPYLESALETDDQNEEVIRTLMNIYSITGQDDKFKSMKQKLDNLGN